MVSLFHEKFRETKERLLNESSIVEKMIDFSTRAIIERNCDLLEEIPEYEVRVNALEVEIFDLCTSIIARFQPEARDLRTILTIIKMNNELERIGDLASNVSESACSFLKEPVSKPLVDIAKMSEITKSMVSDSITAFTESNASLAKEILLRDDEVDILNRKAFEKLMKRMHKNSENIDRALKMIRVCHNIERMADMSTNIAEEVVFMCEGRLVQHGHSEEEE